ncbi:MAG: hypothetical protein KF892_08520 [Rhizobacter sp.]|nr:hypothetical protein [Rhizobacter sp.]
MTNFFGTVGRYGMVVAVSMLATACAEKGPTCSDKLVLDTVKSFYQDSVEESLSLVPEKQHHLREIETAVKIQFDAVRTVAKNAELGRQECEVQMSAAVPPSVAELAVSPNARVFFNAAYNLLQRMKVKDGRVETTVYYEVQPSDDKSHTFVKARGAQEFGQLVAHLSVLGALKQAAPKADTPNASGSDSTQAKTEVPATETLPQCVMPAGEIKGDRFVVHGSGTRVFQSPDHEQVMTTITQPLAVWAVERRSGWLKLTGASDSEPYAPGQAIGWVRESDVMYVAFRECN